MRGSPPLSTGDTIQDPQWMPKTLDNTEPYIYYSFPIHIPMTKLKLYITYRKRLTITHNKIEQ